MKHTLSGPFSQDATGTSVSLNAHQKPEANQNVISGQEIS